MMLQCTQAQLNLKLFKISLVKQHELSLIGRVTEEIYSNLQGSSRTSKVNIFHLEAILLLVTCVRNSSAIGFSIHEKYSMNSRIYIEQFEVF